jgi:hypothetical protein
MMTQPEIRICYAASHESVNDPYIPPDREHHYFLILCGHVGRFSQDQFLDYIENLYERGWDYIFYVPSWTEFSGMIYDDALRFIDGINLIFGSRLTILVNKSVTVKLLHEESDEQYYLHVTGCPLWPNAEYWMEKGQDLKCDIMVNGTQAADKKWLEARHKEGKTFLKKELSTAEKNHFRVVITGVQPFYEEPKHLAMRLLQCNDLPLLRWPSLQAWFYPSADELRTPGLCSDSLLASTPTRFIGASRSVSVHSHRQRMGQSTLRWTHDDV